MNALIITSKLVQDHEFIYPFYRLKEEGYQVITCNCEDKIVKGYFTDIKAQAASNKVNVRCCPSTMFSSLFSSSK